MKAIKYIGPVLDYSGYGAAARSYVVSLHKAGVEITVEPRCFDTNAPPIDDPEERAVLEKLIGRPIDYDVVIVHLTPDLLPPYVQQEQGKYIVSMTVWETSKLHPKWVAALNTVDEVWVPCDWNAECFASSGVTKPIFKVPHGINPNHFSGVKPKAFGVSNVDKSKTFVFYSVFQWNHRKNPLGLLRAYYNAFGPHDNVLLLLKSYVGSHVPADAEQNYIRDHVGKTKMDMNLSYYPRVSLITDKLSSQSLKEFYLYGDCYVSLHHGEGWGLTCMEAGLAGKPVIATGATGNVEFMTPENSYLVPYQWTYVQHMSSFNGWYLGDQEWADPNLIEASRLMRRVYNHRQEASEKGALLKRDIQEKFNWVEVSKPIINRLKEI